MATQKRLAAAEGAADRAMERALKEIDGEPPKPVINGNAPDLTPQEVRVHPAGSRERPTPAASPSPPQAYARRRPPPRPPHSPRRPPPRR